MDSTDPGPDKAAKKVVESEIKSSAAEPTITTPAASMSDVPDPDEDDLDDLDDMLGDFSGVKLDSKKPPAEAGVASGASAKTAASSLDAQFSEDDFAKQIESGMESLLGDLKESKQPDMPPEWTKMLKDLAANGIGEGETGGAGGADASFQETIRATMERMQNSGDQATAAAAEGGSDDFLSELLKQASSTGEGGEEAFSKMLMDMMEQLTNKDILYEPMKELHEKFPEWLEKNKTETPAEEFGRYQEQHKLVNEIVARFELASYSDSDTADREYIVERMQKMQELGSPPSDLVGDLDTAQDALAGADEQCNPQ